MKSLIIKLEYLYDIHYSPYNTLTSIGVNVILQSLINFRELTSLHFYLEEDNKADDTSLALLGEVLVSNPGLTYLHLQFGCDTVLDTKGWIMLG